MKKFVLHCIRCTVVTRFCNLDFARISKKGTLGTRFLSKTFFLSEQVNFSASDRLGRNFPTVQNGLEKGKNLYLIKSVLKWKRAIRKMHTRFLVFHFWDLKLVPINSALNSAKMFFLQFWNVLCDIFEPKIFCRKLTRNRVYEIAFVKF